MTDSGAPTVLRVVRGNVTAEEAAALVAALALARATAARRAAARAAADRGLAGGRRSGWGDRSRLSSAPIPRGPGAWRASALPR